MWMYRRKDADFKFVDSDFLSYGAVYGSCSLQVLDYTRTVLCTARVVCYVVHKQCAMISTHAVNMCCAVYMCYSLRSGVTVCTDAGLRTTSALCMVAAVVVPRCCAVSS